MPRKKVIRAERPTPLSAGSKEGLEVPERTDVEKSLYREQEFVRRLIQCFPDMIAVLDREGRFTYVSERVREILGVPPETYIGREVGSSAHPEDRKALIKAVEAIVSGKAEISQIEARVLHADGSWHILRSMAGPMFDEEGKITGVVASVRDVTESNLAEQQTARRERLAAMGQMMAGAAHELNNPLTAILGVADLLRERAGDDATRRQLDLILQQARRAAGIIQNLLAFSRPAAHGRAKIRLEELLREVIRAQSPALGRKNIVVEFEAIGPLAAVEGDRRLLSQVFSNLIINAEQSILAAQGRGTIKISARGLNDRVSVTISDDGPGIPPENLAKVFDPFFTTKRPGGGSGLGLTICLAVVKDHGGTIEAESKPGSGASLRVSLPAVVESANTSPQPSAASAKPAGAGSDVLANRKVLVVDDEEGIREIIREALSARGIQVQSVASSEDAISCLAANSCDVVICDFNLPGTSGENFYDRLSAEKGAEQLPRFVFVTGELVDSEMSDRLRKKGAMVLQKPFRISALADIVLELMQPQPSSIA